MEIIFQNYAQSPDQSLHTDKAAASAASITESAPTIATTVDPSTIDFSTRIQKFIITPFFGGNGQIRGSCFSEFISNDCAPI